MNTRYAAKKRNESWFGEQIQSDTGRIEKPRSEEDVVRMLQDPALPTPIRPVGSRHSMTACISARGASGWGTLVDMTGITRLSDGKGLRFETRDGKPAVTVPAGRTFIEVAREVREQKGLQFRVNTELGTLTMGAAACGATKDSSFPGEPGQVCSDVVGMRLVRPDGKAENLDESHPDFRALRCSYGLFGIVTELTYRLYPLHYISVQHEKVVPEEFEARSRGWLAEDNAVFLYMFPFRNRIVAELRRKPATGDGEIHERCLRLETRNHFWEKGAHTVDRVARRLSEENKRRTQDAFDKVLQEYFTRVLRVEKVNPVAQIVDFDPQDAKHRFTFSMWAFPEREFPAMLQRYFELCRKHEAALRTSLPHASYHIGEDTSSLLSYSRKGPVWTLDPICPEGLEGWEPFLHEFNALCSGEGGMPLLNQTPFLTREYVRNAFRDCIDDFEQARRRFDPQGRMLNAYFAEFLRP